MVVIDIPSTDKKDSFIGDNVTSTFTLSNSNPTEVHVYVSGIYLTENEDYTISGNQITFIDVPLSDENINILYKI
jgi:hypothetical protein